MEKFVRLCDRLSVGCGVASGFLMIVSTLLVLTEILVRSAFSKTLYITEEYSGYMIAAMTFLALAYTLKDKSHIRMTFLHTIAKGKAKVWVDIFAFSVGFVFCSLLTYTTVDLFWDSAVTASRSMQISQTYLAIPQFFMPFGVLVMAMQFAAEVARSILLLRSGHVDNVEAESTLLGR
ncbi:MAG: TRAP transporter small permease subunit [Negativicutes bacterium]